MPLNEPTPPDIAQSTFLQGVGAATNTRQLRFSLPIHVLSLKELTNDDPDLAPRAVGWHFVAVDERGLVAGDVPNLPDRTDRGEQLTTSLTFGLVVEAAWKAYGQVRKLPEVQSQSFELRTLRITGLRIDAFWLKAAPFDGRLYEKDRLYAFLAFQKELKNKLVSARDFLEIVRKLAAKRILVDNAPNLPEVD